MTSKPSDANAAVTPLENPVVISRDVKESLTRKGCALLIGVEDYSAYDPRGGKNLLAGRNDVLAYWKVCRRLGYPVENIHLYTSPKLTLADIVHAELEVGPEIRPNLHNSTRPTEDAAELQAQIEKDLRSRVFFEEATAEKLLEGFQWLASNLPIFSKGVRTADKSKVTIAHGTLPGFLTYSGHGAQVSGDLALCPSDIGPGLGKALTFERLRGIIDAAGREDGDLAPADKLTVVLDCCFAAREEVESTKRISTLSAPGKEVKGAKTEIGSRVFCASSRDGHAYQAILGGRWHSAFTWAITVALEQWKMITSGSLKRSTISHFELLFRARMLLEALSFPQHPILVDELGNLPVFDQDTEAGDATSADPNATRTEGQLPPDCKIVIEGLVDNNTTMIATVYVISAKTELVYSDRSSVIPASVTPTEDTEYWWYAPTMPDLSKLNTVKITRSAILYDKSTTLLQVVASEQGSPNFVSPVAFLVPWSSNPKTYENEGSYFGDSNTGLQLVSNGDLTGYKCIRWWHRVGSTLLPAGTVNLLADAAGPPKDWVAKTTVPRPV